MEVVCGGTAVRHIPAAAHSIGNGRLRGWKLHGRCVIPHRLYRYITAYAAAEYSVAISVYSETVPSGGQSLLPDSGANVDARPFQRGG